uniref:AlNc14C432G11596 protein n=1 Tax=Albugo laibachii Nc14 TaxID=890382 RepID=F0WZK5_9STRA|nr:AlNc14C432G11596 [Albugo laibachii Nc14]|eukprot:CCA26929.1 AlNc14C432G11596 [Albugo laibachii Nc14]
MKAYYRVHIYPFPGLSHLHFRSYRALVHTFRSAKAFESFTSFNPAKGIPQCVRAMYSDGIAPVPIERSPRWIDRHRFFDVQTQGVESLHNAQRCVVHFARSKLSNAISSEARYLIVDIDLSRDKEILGCLSMILDRERRVSHSVDRYPHVEEEAHYVEIYRIIALNRKRDHCFDFSSFKAIFRLLSLSIRLVRLCVALTSIDMVVGWSLLADRPSIFFTRATLCITNPSNISPLLGSYGLFDCVWLLHRLKWSYKGRF